MPQPYKLLIIGGGLAAVSALDILARDRAVATCAILCAEPHLPYDRPPLSKDYLLGQTRREEVFLKSESFYKENGIEVFINTRAAKLDTTHRTVTAEDGRSFAFENLMIATGSELHRLRIPGHALEGIYYLRQINDSEAIQSAVKVAKQAVIVGAGFIGLEVAAAFQQMGIAVTVLETGHTVFPRLATPELSDFFLRYYQRKGVKFVFQDKIEAFEGEKHLKDVRTASGLRIPCDVAVVGVGVRPVTDFLEGSRLEISNGVIVNEHMETFFPGIYAAGDVANYYDPVYKKQRRIEHWDNAIKQGRVVAQNLLGRREPYSGVSYFFSAVWDLHWQLVGDNEESDARIIRGSMEERKFGVLYLKNNCLRAMFLLGLPFKERQIAERLIVDEVDLSGYLNRLSDLPFPLGEISSSNK